MIRFACPSCKTVLQTAPDQAGKTMACPKCKVTMKVPAAAPAPIMQTAPPPAPAPAPAPVLWYYTKNGQ